MKNAVINYPSEYFHKSQVWYRGEEEDKQLLWDWGSAALAMVEAESELRNSQPMDITRLKNVVLLDANDPDYKRNGYPPVANSGIPGVTLAGPHLTAPSYNQSPGGLHPQGWKCDRLPYFVDFDVVSPGYEEPLFAPKLWNFTYSMCDRVWFVTLPKDDRKGWLGYAYDRLKCLDKNAFLSMPGYFETTRYNQSSHKFEGGYLYLANGSDVDLVSTINNLWSGDPRSNDDNRFSLVNSRDGHAYPTFSSTDKVYVGDFNSDGYANDVLVTANKESGVNSSWQGTKLYISTGTDFEEYTLDAANSYAHPITQGLYPSWGERIYVGDFDGNGSKNDIAVTPNTGLGISAPQEIRFLKTVITLGSNMFRFVDMGAVPIGPANSSNWDEILIVGDFNKDRRDDILAYPANAGSYQNAYRIICGSGSNWSNTTPQYFSWVANNCSNCNVPSYREKFYAGDFDGDGYRNEFCTTANYSFDSWQGLRLYKVRGTTGALTTTFVKEAGCDNTSCFPSWGENLYVGKFDPAINDNTLNPKPNIDDIITTGNGALGVYSTGYRVLVAKYTDSNDILGSLYFDKKEASGYNDQCSFPSWGERFHIGDYNRDGFDDFLVTANKQLGIPWVGWSMYHSLGSGGAFRGLASVKQVAHPTGTTARKSQDGNSLQQLYPNPASDKLTINHLVLVHEYTVTIRDIAGREVMKAIKKTDSASTLAVDVRDLPNGLYYLQLADGLEVAHHFTFSKE